MVGGYRLVEYAALHHFPLVDWAELDVVDLTVRLAGRERRQRLGVAPAPALRERLHDAAFWRGVQVADENDGLARAFGCKPGDAMVRSEQEQVRIW